MFTQRDCKKNIRTFAAATFFNDLGSDMIASIWPLFLTTVLKANMTALGFIDGIGGSLVALSKALSGYLSDRLGQRKVFIWAGYLMGALGRFGFALTQIWTHLIPFKILERVGKERSAPRDALVAEISAPEKLGRNFGFLRAMDHLGGICGVLITIILIRFMGFRSIILLGAAPALLSAWLVFSLIKEPKNRAPKESFGKVSVKSSRRFRMFLFISAIYSLGAFSYSFLLLFAREHGFSLQSIPLLYLIITAPASAASLVFGRISDRVGRKPVLIVAYLLWIAVLGGYLLSQSQFMIILGLVLYGLHLGIINPTWRAAAAEISPAGHLAGYIGMFQMVTGLCALPASFLAGFLWETIGVYAPLFFSLGLTILSGIFLLFWKYDKVSSHSELSPRT
jgi:MFS family permease